MISSQGCQNHQIYVLYSSNDSQHFLELQKKQNDFQLDKYTIAVFFSQIFKTARLSDKFIEHSAVREY